LEPKVLIIQPFIPHYRADFFIELSKKITFDIVTINKPDLSEGFKLSKKVIHKNIKTYNIGRLKFFNPFSKYILKYETIIISWSPNWISMYILLLFKKILSLKIVIWTHGISIKRDFDSKTIRDLIKIFFFNRADGICFYTNSGLKELKSFLSRPKLFYINNTLNVEKIQSIKSSLNSTPDQLKNKYGINASRTIIYCARFIEHRRVDILVDFIETMITNDVDFIIIGGGQYKPDFTKYSNVNDFGKLYDENTKSELYSIADFSFQPAWSGLSVVESIANGIPYTTLKKSKQVMQCVEYSYIKNGINGFIAEDLFELKKIILNIDDKELNKMKNNCIDFSIRELSLINMVNRFKIGISNI